MRKVAMALAAGAALISGAAAEAKPKLTGEEELAKILKDRVAGEPVDCITLFDARDQRVIEKTAIVYGNGSTLYVNRTRNPQDLDDDDIMVTDTHSTQLCSIDTVRLRDRSSFMYNGFLSLDKFVPYRRAK